MPPSIIADAATHDARQPGDRRLEANKEGGGTPRGSAARPHPSDAEDQTGPTEDAESSLPALGGLKLSLLGSYDAASKSPPAGLFPAGRYACVGAVSPAESARSSASNRGEKSVLPLSDPPDTGAARWNGQPLSSSTCSSSSSPAPLPTVSSPRVDKLLHLPRGRSLRFFIDGDEGLANEKGSES